MVNRNTEIRVSQSGMDYGPRPYGSMAGQPTVTLKLSKSDTKAKEAGSIDSLFQNYNWKWRLNNGFARLLVHGNDPLSELHSESFEAIEAVLSPRFVDVELSTEDIRVPDRQVQNMVDHYSLFVDLDGDVDWDAFEWFTDNGSHFGSVDFVFPVDSASFEDEVENISREYKIYDSDIWIYPRGTKVNTVARRLDKITDVAKRNSWNVSPRHDVLEGYEEEE